MATIDALKGPSLMPTSNQPVTSVVVLLHGFGVNGENLMGLARLFAPVMPHTAFYSPNGPHPLENNPGAYQWLAPEILNARRAPANRNRFRDFRPGTEAGAKTVNRFLDQVLEHHALEPSRLALLGFSQGTMMSLHVGVRRERQIAGILGYSGSMSGADHLPGDIKSHPPVMLIVGESDSGVPVEAVTNTAKALTLVGVHCETHVIPGLGHSIGGQGPQLGVDFLIKSFA